MLVRSYSATGKEHAQIRGWRVALKTSNQRCRVQLNGCTLSTSCGTSIKVETHLRQIKKSGNFFCCCPDFKLISVAPSPNHYVLKRDDEHGNTVALKIDNVSNVMSSGDFNDYNNCYQGYFSLLMKLVQREERALSYNDTRINQLNGMSL